MINQFINFLHKKQELAPIIDRPYQFTEGAKERLDLWGVSSQLGEKLISLGNQYSYCYPDKRVENMLSGGLRLSTDSKGWQKIIIPKYVNFDPNDPYGECSELARRAMISGDRDKIFSGFSGKNGKIKPLLVSGYSPTHFNKGAQRHYWVGLIPEKLYPQDVASMVVFDPSFRTITTLGESGYNLNNRINGSTVSDEIPKVQEVPRMISVGRLALRHSQKSFAPIFSEKGETIYTSDSSTVLGITPDYKYGLALLFGRDVVTNKLHSAIELRSEDGQIAFLAIQAKQDETYFRQMNGQNLAGLSEQNRKLTDKLLQTMDDGLAKYGIK